jgi:hypothetical protein
MKLTTIFTTIKAELDPWSRKFEQPDTELSLPQVRKKGPVFVGKATGSETLTDVWGYESEFDSLETFKKVSRRVMQLNGWKPYQDGALGPKKVMGSTGQWIFVDPINYVLMQRGSDIRRVLFHHPEDTNRPHEIKQPQPGLVEVSYKDLV